MNEEIESTIKEITRSVIQFDNDIEKRNSEGLKKFLSVFVRLLERYSKMMLKTEYKGAEYYLNFKDEISDVYDYLFTDSNIFNIAEKSIDVNEGITGTILAIKRNGNPLRDNRSQTLKKSIGEDPYREFISINQSLYDKRGNDFEPVEYVLKESVITKLYEEYRGEFPGETMPLWKQRWINDKHELTKINIDHFKVGNNKHLLLSILDTAYEFKILKINNFEDYVKTRWGMTSYYRDVSIYLKDRDAKPYPGFIKIKKILKSE